MYFLINILGIFIVMSVIYFCSPRKKSVKWRPILSLFIVELLVTWFMLGTKIGGWAINLIASFFSWLIACASDGIAFAFPSVMGNETVDFFFSALLPIIFVVTFFDILAYFGILTWMIDKIGWVISKVSRLPKLESFFSIQMMFLGNTEALAVIRGQLAVLKDNRLLTFGIMSMSSISGSILGSYLTMVPATYVFTAIPLNCLNALILASILNPVEVTKDEDIIYVPPKEEKKDFFSTISNSMMVGMLRMRKRALSSRSASVFTFTKRTWPLRSSATSSNIGAKLRHGPHHGAQKSTTTGRSSFRSLSSVSPVALITSPSNSSCPQRPHFAASCMRSCGIRFNAWQLAHTVFITNLREAVVHSGMMPLCFYNVTYY